MDKNTAKAEKAIANLDDAEQRDDAAPKAPMVEVRAMRSDAFYGIEAGELASLPEPVAIALAASGAVDPHPDAVAYARQQRAAREMLVAAQSAVDATA